MREEEERGGKRRKEEERGERRRMEESRMEEDGGGWRRMEVDGPSLPPHRQHTSNAVCSGCRRSER